MAAIRLLLVEDDEDDYFLTKDCLEGIHGKEVEIEWIQEYETAMERLRADSCDICFLDYRIGGRTGLEFLEAVRHEELTTPIVLLTGVGQHDIDVAATEAGAADYIDKSELSPEMAERTIRYAVAQAEARRNLAEKSSLLETTLENATAGIAAFDPDGKLAQTNEVFDDFLKAFMMQADADLAPLDLIKQTCVDENATVATLDGSVFDMTINPTPRGGHVVVVVDITEQKALQLEMEAARIEAENANRAKSAFFSSITHELRTPLHNILGFADLIMHEGSVMEPQECARYIQEGGNSLLDIVNSLLEYSRLESGYEPENNGGLFELDFILASIAEGFSAAAEQNGVELQVTIDPTIDGLYLEEGALRSIFSRLAQNAVRFSPDGGTVELLISINDAGEIVLSVSDEGIGMKKDFVEKILSPFAQADDGLDRSFEGIGLGLSIVKLLATALEAKLEIVSGRESGTTASLILAPETAILKAGTAAAQNVG